jgi:tetratricopeptide (TPR) repeat protein
VTAADAFKADEKFPNSSARKEPRNGFIPDSRIDGLVHAEDTGDGLYYKIRRLNDGADTFDDALHELYAAGFLTTNSEESLFSIPQHIRSVLIRQMSQTQKERWLECALHAVDALLPAATASAADWAEVIGTVPHARHCLDVYDELGVPFFDCSQIVFNIAGWLADAHRLVEAIPFNRRMIAELENVYGSEDSRLALPVFLLAEGLRIDGTYGEAEVLFGRAERLFAAKGDDGIVDGALCLHNRAAICRDSGRYSEAETLFQRALPVIKNSLSPGALAEAINDYALLLVAMGRTEEAASLRRLATSSAAGA